MAPLYIYLHGFASSPRSHKCLFFQDQWTQRGLTLHSPDLNQPIFEQLTLTRQIEQVKTLIHQANPSQVTLIGSSFGGLTAAWVAQHCPQVTQLILLAPAFDFNSYWHQHLSPQDRDRWQREDYWPVYHYGYQTKERLHHNFLQDLAQYDESQLNQPIPTLIFHGIKDQTIPIAASTNYQRSRPWVHLQPLDSGHSLTNRLDQIWDIIQSQL